MNLDLTDPLVKSEIIHRFNQLSPVTPALWGKMNASQMLAHCNAQIRVALGDDKLPPSIIGKLFGRFLKKKVLDEKPYSRNLPTAPSFVVKQTPDFEDAKKKLLESIHKFDNTGITKEAHPFFGKMTVEEWSRGTWKHLEHHLKQFGL